MAWYRPRECLANLNFNFPSIWSRSYWSAFTTFTAFKYILTGKLNGVRPLASVVTRMSSHTPLLRTTRSSAPHDCEHEWYPPPAAQLPVPKDLFLADNYHSPLYLQDLSCRELVGVSRGVGRGVNEDRELFAAESARPRTTQDLGRGTYSVVRVTHTNDPEIHWSANVNRLATPVETVLLN